MYSKSYQQLEAEKKDDSSSSTFEEYDPSSFSTSADGSDVVGTGNFSVVRRCNHQQLGKVVVKCMNIGGTADSTANALNEARKRVLVLTRFKHENIVCIYGMMSWGQCFGIIMEEINCGNLNDLLFVKKAVKVIPWSLRHRIILQLANALDYLHHHDTKNSYVHLDVKPENILLTTNLNVKLADFGALDTAKATGAKPTLSISKSNQYTPLYTAPERLQRLFGEPTTAMDVYSFAMICYEVITRQEVFQDARASIGLLTNVISFRGQKPNQEHIDSVEQNLKQHSSEALQIFNMLRRVMENCWCFEPKDRYSMKQVIAVLNSTITDLAKILLLNRKSIEYENNVSLKHHSPPFQNVSLKINPVVSTCRKYQETVQLEQLSTLSLDKKSSIQMAEPSFKTYSQVEVEDMVEVEDDIVDVQDMVSSLPVHDVNSPDMPGYYNKQSFSDGLYKNVCCDFFATKYRIV